MRIKAEKAALQQELDSQYLEIRKWQDSSVRGESRLQGTDGELKRVKTQYQVTLTFYFVFIFKFLFSFIFFYALILFTRVKLVD